MPKKLLVADKSVVIQKSVGITFAQEDYTVTYVSDGEDAIQRVRQLKPDLLLIHIGTPKLSGYDVCDRLRKDPQTAGLPVLLMVGIHEQLDEAKAKSVGADGHIIKPFESQALIDRVTELVSKRAAAQAPSTPETVPPKPAAAPSPSPPSPASTISGQSPYSAPPSAPSPTSTISGQPPISRDAPMLDLDIASPEVAPASESDVAFEFSLEDSVPAETTVAALPEADEPPPVQVPEPRAAVPATWDFAEPTQTGPSLGTAPPEAAEPPMAPVMESPMQETAELFGASGADLDFEMPQAEPPASELPFAEPFPEPVESAAPAFAEIPAPAVEAPLEPESKDWSLFGGTVDFDAEAPAFKSEPILVERNSTPEPHEVFSAPEPEIPSPSASGGNGSGDVTLSDSQVEAIVSRVFERVIERIAWEVVPDLAERIIKEELARLTQEKS